MTVSAVAVATESPIMNACPDEDKLLRFLDGELSAKEDAWIVVHVEDCTLCQQRLERLTRCRPASVEESTPELSRVDGGPNGDEVATGIGDRELTAGQSSRCRSTDFADAPRETIKKAPKTTDPRGQDVREPVLDHGTENPAPWPVVAGYDILQRLGEGGMGVVYKARHRGLNRLVALKMIRGGTQARADSFTRFRVEAESETAMRWRRRRSRTCTADKAASTRRSTSSAGGSSAGRNGRRCTAVGPT
jgi:eukaryotic-like serine/threonine-protein kinase